LNMFKYLGFILSSDLSWTPQVESVCTKARKLLGLLHRCFHNDIGTLNTLLELYTTLVRPHLEYVIIGSERKWIAITTMRTR